MKVKIINWILLLALTCACAPASLATIEPVTATSLVPPADTATSAPAEQLPSATPFVPPTIEVTPTFTIVPTETNTPIPVVDKLKAKVTADLLSCRYGPGSEYLYLYGLNKNANIRLSGRAYASNWVMVDGKNKCWVNAKFLEIEGNLLSLPMTYPGEYKLPVSPYYPPTIILSATRNKSVPDSIDVSWDDIPLIAGDEEDENMNHYIIEVWRCEAGVILFEALATNDTSISFIDQTGCNEPSHGRVFVQEKHGFAGPADIPWPEHP
jgi:hypothetical protein